MTGPEDKLKKILSFIDSDDICTDMDKYPEIV